MILCRKKGWFLILWWKFIHVFLFRFLLYHSKYWWDCVNYESPWDFLKRFDCHFRLFEALTDWLLFWNFLLFSEDFWDLFLWCVFIKVCAIHLEFYEFTENPIGDLPAFGPKMLQKSYLIASNFTAICSNHD